MRKGIKLVPGRVVELDPGKNYLLLFEADTLSQETVATLSDMLAEEGITGISVLIDGDPSKVKVIGQPKS